jgi:ubiquinone/menaquinone biosynthesis C-methylase UbiE
LLSAHKRQIFAGLRGEVVEIGPGSGDNFAFFPAGLRWTGIEPNLFMHRLLEDAIQRFNIQGEIRTGTAEKTNLPDASADAVVCTFVLCSVGSPDAALGEVLRVLRPGGQFAFIEHVIAPEKTMLRRTQHLIKPVWKFAADGCNPDRDTEAAIRRAGFSQVDVEVFRMSVPIIGTCIAGIAVK